VDPPSVKQIIQKIDVQMQTTHNQSRSQPAPTAPPARTGAGHVIFVARRAIDLLASQGAWAGTRNASNRRVSSCCWSAGLVMDRKTIPGNTRGACRLLRCTSNVTARSFSRRTRISKIRGGTSRRRDRTAKGQQTLAYACTTSHGSSLDTKPGATWANTKHAHATHDSRH